MSLQPGSWTEHTDFDIQHFSGTAVYRQTFTIPADLGEGGAEWWLDLSDLANIATIFLNEEEVATL